MSTRAVATGQQDAPRGQAELIFDAPGPGAWLRDRVHAPRPWSRYGQEILPPALATGFRTAGLRYGWLDDLELRFVHGFGYVCVRAVEDAEVPARIAAAERALATRVWRADAERWERAVKPAAIRAHLALQAVDPRALTRAELLAHLERCRAHHRRMCVLHHALSGAALGPVGELIARAGEWTGIDVVRIVALARGLAPEAVAASAELDRLVGAVAHDRDARALLHADGDPREILSGLVELHGEAGRAAARYVGGVGYRLLDSHDVGDPCALEVPAVVVQRLRRAVEHGGARDRRPSEREVARVRDGVPAEHRVEFERLLGESRRTSRIRCELATFSDVWAGGLARRAMLAAGEMLVRDGRIAAPAHLVEAEYAEMRELIAGDGGPAGDELARRAQIRRDQRRMRTPGALGDALPAALPLDALPPTARRANRALNTALGALFGASDVASDAATVRGIAASCGTYTGTARVIRGPEELARLHQGDVLVTVSATAAVNIVAPVLGAVVTDFGGVLSPAATISRENAIPGVVGAGDATTLIPDGALIRVTGDSGEVEVMG